MDSVWTQTARLPRFEKLTGEVTTDVLIVGGGMAGILCAYMLTRSGVDNILVEANTVCSGITKNTTAKITSQHGLIYEKLIKKFGVEAAKIYLEANQAALEKYRVLCGNIDCDFEEKDAYVYSLTDRRKIEKEAAALIKMGIPSKITTDLPLPFQTAGAIRFSRQAQFHPLKFISAIVPELKIFENTKVVELMPGCAVTTDGKIRAKRIIIATHFPILNKHGGYFIKMYQHRSYVLAVENGPDVAGMYVDEADKGMSFRNYKNMLLIGGGGHHTGKKGGNWQELEEFVRRNYPAAREVARWATQDCMTLDGVPYIGPYSKNTRGLFVATGFNKWGMTSSMVAAMILSDMVQGKANPYARIFEPSRTVLRPQLAVNAAESVINLLTPTVPRCPHMGCALKYNPHEHSWDCPCHGSRFTEDGQLLDNPATDDKKM